MCASLRSVALVLVCRSLPSFVLVAFAQAGFLATSIHADSLQVPSEYVTIQAAVDAAVDGDSIIVAPGSYLENFIQIRNKRLSIVGAGRDATFLSSNPAIAFQIRQNAEVSLSGFDITSPASGASPSFAVDDARLSLELCRIHHSNGGASGGGAIAASADASISCVDVLFIENHGITGAVDVTGAAQAHFTRCRFEGNVADQSLNYAGAASILARDVGFMDCEFVGNRNAASSIALTGALYIAGELGGTAVVERCLFFDNQGTNSGAILAELGGALSIQNCTFDRNTSEKGFSAISVGLSGSTTSVSLSNCIVTRNGPTPALSCTDGALVVRCSDIWGNGDDTVCPGGGDNISLDPMFCGPDRWDLQSDSPCAFANSPTCGLIGMLDSGCGANSVQQTTWGQIKATWGEREH